MKTGDTGPTGQGYTARGVYSAGTTYAAYDTVYYNGNQYRCKLASTGNSPLNTTYWEKFAQGINTPSAYSAIETYSAGDLVTRSGSTYYCIATTTGNAPPNATYWLLFASQGDTGDTGPQGPAGASGVDLFFSPSSDIGLNGGANVSAGVTYDCFNLANGVTVTKNSTYYVDYLILGTFTAGASAAKTIRAAVAGNAVSSVNFHTALGTGATASSSGGTFANPNIGYMNTTTDPYSLSATATLTGGSFALRVSGLLRTNNTGDYFKIKVGLSAVNSTAITVLSNSYGSLTYLGSNSVTTLGTWA